MKQTKTKLPSGLHTLLWREGKWYVAKCVEVEVASQGKTKPQAIRNLQEALSLYLDEESFPQPPALREIELRTLTSYA